MQDNSIRSRLKAQLTKFISQLSEGLSKPLEIFVGEMLFSIRASQDMKLSNVARSLEENIPLIKTEDRLSRNLKAKALESHLGPRLASLLWHPALPILCARRRDQENSLSLQSQCAR